MKVALDSAVFRSGRSWGPGKPSCELSILGCKVWHLSPLYLFVFIGVVMDWARLLSTERLGREGESQTGRPGRTEYESDIGRISFSGAFRRLARKTQVHPLAPNDHVHTRLTHSLEVAYVGRALGRALATRIIRDLPRGTTPDDIGTIVQAACLAHDLGNPPFGHGGEEGMIYWFETNGPSIFKNLTPDYRRDLIAVEGNAQGFRTIAQTENYLFNGGLQLTYATLGSFHKYPWTSRKGDKKFGCFLSEEDILEKVATKLELIEIGPKVWSRHPLAHLVEAADDICYSIIDLEDAVELKILTFEEVVEFFLQSFSRSEQKSIRSRFEPGNSHRINLARLRAPLFDRMVETVIETYLGAYNEIMEGRYNESIFDLLPPADPRLRMVYGAKKFAQSRVYNDAKKIEMEIGCYATFDTLLTQFCFAALNQAEVLADGNGETKLSWKAGHVLKLLGDHSPTRDNAPSVGWSSYQCLRRVIDYVTGMTDNYATYVARQMQGAAVTGVQRP